MNRTCENCYFLCHNKYNKFYFCANHSMIKEIPTETCDYHGYSCSECHAEAEYIHNKTVYCLDCLFKKLDVEEHITTSYYQDGEYLGTDDDIAEVLENLNEDITML